MLKALDGLTWLSRMLVGALFVVSGLIKSNDALGFMYKLEEYFEPGAMNLEFLDGHFEPHEAAATAR